MFRRLLAVTAVVATLLSLTGVAFAFFSSTGTGYGSATTGTLAAPTAVSGAQRTGTGTVDVSWTASTGSPTPAGYYVTRSSGSATDAACGTSAANPTTSTSCTDQAVGVGSYTYVVVAVYATWTAPSAPSTVAVVQAAQAITFGPAPANPTFGGSYTVTATGGGSGSPVTFSSGSTGVCAVSGNTGGSGTGSATVSFVHAGDCTIHADQDGNTYYAAAAQATTTFAVAKTSQAIHFSSTAPTNATVGSAGYTPTAGGGGSGQPVAVTVDGTPYACTISNGVVTYQHVGTCTLDANQDGNTDYLPANQVQQSFAVGQGAQAITFTSSAPPTAPVGSAGYRPTATGGGSANTVTFTIDSASARVCTIDGTGLVTYQQGGTCTIDANQAGNTDYLAAGQVQQSITVTKLSQTVSIWSTAPTNASVGGATYQVAATADSHLAVVISGTDGVCTVSPTDASTITFVGAGTCTVTASQAGNDVYAAAPTKTQTFTVVAAPPKDTTPPTVASLMNGRTTWISGNSGKDSWDKAACGGHMLCVTYSDTGTPASGVDASSVTFSLVDADGKCFDSTAGTFTTGSCSIAVTAADTSATASVPQSVMVTGSYTFTAAIKDGAGNPTTGSVTLTVTAK